MSAEQHNQDHQLVISKLPRTAVQALYHAVTGKTETLAQPFFGNVIIKDEDIENLLSVITEQIGHYHLVAEPTITIVVKDGNARATTYSSWPRYRELRISSKEITSEVLLKVEFVMTLPGTDTDQRCIINVGLDSALPIVCNPKFGLRLREDFVMFMRRSGGWNAVDVSIDFVDFLVAKNFMSHVEEWFKGLKPTAKPRMSGFLVESHETIRLIIMQAGRIGLACFLLFSVLFSNNALTLERVVMITALGMLLMAVIQVSQSKVATYLRTRILGNFIPGVILLTPVDHEKYDSIIRTLSSPGATLLAACGTVLTSMAINIASSYIYTYWTPTP
ncbi:hypothetical protein [Neorhizobium sp. T7_12]|uniref:hypothetical protein n=1 Tax=Neorhizobium sp. T7_12 TaxID=2093832 RepID=UPI00155EDE00|nr:hypothetical protein [Neorhizobium sp. T7_12]